MKDELQSLEKTFRELRSLSNTPEKYTKWHWAVFYELLIERATVFSFLETRAAELEWNH